MWLRTAAGDDMKPAAELPKISSN
eukprot:COSAG04_NODE_10971_length_740_cov_1.352574_1_plen_23_part_10